MFIIRNIPENKYFADIKHATVTADLPDLSDSVTGLAYSMLKSFTPHTRTILLYIAVDIFVAKCRDLHVINVKY